jgi:hypothetical protein
MDVLNPNDPSVMPAPVGAPPTAFPRWGAAQEVGTESLDPVRAVLLPGRDESPAEYLARLKNLHARAGSLISKIEERRAGARDRRTGAGNRRRDIDRRRNVRSLPWEGGLRFDRTTLIWIVQVSAWIAIVVLALVYGIGTS